MSRMKARALFNATRRERASIELSKIEVPSPGRIGKPVEIVDTSESRWNKGALESEVSFLQDSTESVRFSGKKTPISQLRAFISRGHHLVEHLLVSNGAPLVIKL